MRVVAIFWMTALLASSLSAQQQYKSTTLPFSATIAMDAGGVISQTIGSDGKPHPSCSDSISLDTGLKLGGRDIPLKSRKLSDSCMVQTKDFGAVMVRVNFGTIAAQILVTPQQEEAFKKFLASPPPASPSGAQKK